MFANRIIPSRALPVLAATLTFLFAPGAWAVCTANHGNPHLVEATPTEDFDTSATDGTVIHTKTGLMWKRCAEGQTWNSPTCSGSPSTFGWQGTLAAAATSTFAGYSDWRLPSVKELQSIVETCGYDPAINRAIFPATPAIDFWSASTSGPYPAFAWVVYFVDGGLYADQKTDYYPAARLVRGGQSFDSFDLLLGAVTVSKTMAGAAAGSVPAGTNFPITLTCGATTLGPLNATTAAPVLFTNVPPGICTVSEGTLPTIAGVTWDSPTYAPSETVTVTAGATTPVAVTNTAKVTTYDITTAADPAVGGTVGCTPNPVDYNGSSSCTASANAGHTFAHWSDDCTGSGACALNNVTSAKTVTAQFTLNNYAITATANPTAGGTVSCAPNPVDYNGSSNCSASANAGYTFAHWSGDCTGSGACALNNVTAPKTVTAHFTVAANKTFTGSTATGTGDATATVTGGGVTCGFVPTPQFVPVSSVPVAPPAGYGFPHGLFDFTLANCDGTVTLTITYPSALPAGISGVYWKYGPTPDNASSHWYPMPGATIAGNTATFAITDGGWGDDDLTINRGIVDQGGPGVPGGGAAAAGIPTLSEWALLGLVALLGLSGWWLRRRRSC
ncbi:MAG TPA: IPTL-CTERM sorting domain-containing protein [Candidatus Competibacter sp.]|nr:DUF1566 domain-containing protein [Candidatus Competibacteraceae bacterium]HRW65146.1 IPTL-CTERM sorting domain-containing protein [Candidatus Competibacter sp.]